MAKEQKNYGNDSITSLKGPDRVRLRPAVIFGSDGTDGVHSQGDGASGDVRRAGVASAGRVWLSAGLGGGVHLRRQPVPMPDRVSAAGACADGGFLVETGDPVDGEADLER